MATSGLRHAPSNGETGLTAAAADCHRMPHIGSQSELHRAANPPQNPEQVSAKGTVVAVGRNGVNAPEGFPLFFERTGQLLDRPSMAGRVGKRLRTPIEAPV